VKDQDTDKPHLVFVVIPFAIVQTGFKISVVTKMKFVFQGKIAIKISFKRKNETKTTYVSIQLFFLYNLFIVSGNYVWALVVLK